MPRIFNDFVIVADQNGSSTASNDVIHFVYQSSSYNDVLTSGSLAKIQLNTLEATDQGARGELLFIISDNDLTGSGEPVMRLFHTGSTNEPRVGIGFNVGEPITKALEIKSKRDSEEGTEFVLEGSRISVGAQVGDSAGKINFVINSGSFDDKFTSGSIITIDSVVTGVNETGARGHLLIGASKSTTQPPSPFWRFGYGADPRVGGNFGTMTTGSLNIVRPNNTVEDQITLTHTDESYIGLQYTTSSVNSNAETILDSMNFVTTGHNGIIYDYNLWKDGIGGRTGQIMAVMSASIVEMTDVSTPHIGSGTPPSFTTSLSNETFQLSITNGDGYIFKAFTKKL
jgi:hypothetical protein